MNILHLKERVKKWNINRVIGTRVVTKIRFLDIESTCNTLVKNNGVGREERVKEPMLEIDKLLPSPIITLSEVVYGS